MDLPMLHCRTRNGFTLALAAACVLAPAQLRAQAVHGVVTLEGTKAPVAGALVTLVDGRGTTVRQTTTLDNGRYSLGAAEPGWYRLRIVRIGFQSFLSDSTRLDGRAARRLDLKVPNAVVMLPPIEVAGVAECRRGVGDEAAGVLWDEVRKAIALTERTFEMANYRFVVEQFDRELAPNGALARDIRTRDTMNGQWPIQAADPETLSVAGYVLPASRQFADLIYFGPDATTLFSPAFVNDHCLWSSQSAAGGEVLLHFRPLPSRHTADIRGALTLDRRTLKLRKLTFRFVNVPDWVLRSSAGGELAFAHTPAGVWYISAWRMRVPIPRTSVGLPTVMLHGFRERGGVVLKVQSAARLRGAKPGDEVTPAHHIATRDARAGR